MATRLKGLRLSELSLVDRPANKGARVTIFKRDFTAEERQALADKGQAMPDGSYPIVTVADLENAVQSYGRAKNKTAVKAHIIARAKALDAAVALPDDWSVSKDAAVALPAITGPEDIASALQDYRTRPAEEKPPVKAHIKRKAKALNVEDKLPPEWLDDSAAEKLAKSVYDMMSQPAKPGAKTFADLIAARANVEAQYTVNEKLWPLFDALGDSVRSIVMDDTLDDPAKLNAIRGSIDQFTSAVIAAVPDAEAELEKLAKMSAAGDLTGIPSIAKLKELSMADDPKTVAELQKQVDALTKSVETLTAEKTEALAKASMSDAEKAYCDSLTGKAKTDFLAMSKEDRAKEMKKRDDADAEVYKAADGTVFRKSDDPRLVTMAKRADESERLAKAEREARETAEFTKRAEAELAHLPGEVVAKAKVLKAVAGMDEDARKALDAMLKAGEAAIAKGFQTFGVGKSAPGADSAQGRLDAMIAKHAADHKVDIATATAAVVKSAEGAELDREARAEKRAA